MEKVEASRENGFEEGMKVEILFEEDKYWYATIVTNFGQLLSLEWCGSSETFFHDVKRNNLYQIGSLANVTNAVPLPTLTKLDGDAENVGTAEAEEGNEAEFEDKGAEAATDGLAMPELKKRLQEKSGEIAYGKIKRIPPASINLNEEQINSVISEIESIDVSSIPAVGFSTDLFKKGMVLECDLVPSPDKKWLATVVDNVGGRLLLEWILPDSDKEAETEENTDSKNSFWLFFCHPRIHFPKQGGDINSDQDLKEQFQPPIELENWESFLKDQLAALPKNEDALAKAFLKKCQERRPVLIEPNCIRYCEERDTVLLFPSDLLKLVPATIEKKINDRFIRVKCEIPEDIVTPNDSQGATPKESSSDAPTPDDSQGVSSNVPPIDSKMVKTRIESTMDILKNSYNVMGGKSEVSFMYPVEDTHAILPFNWTDENEIPLELGMNHHDIVSYLRSNNSRAAPIKLKNNETIIKVQSPN